MNIWERLLKPANSEQHGKANRWAPLRAFCPWLCPLFVGRLLPLFVLTSCRFMCSTLSGFDCQGVNKFPKHRQRPGHFDPNDVSLRAACLQNGCCPAPKASAFALQQMPALNGIIDDKTQEIAPPLVWRESEGQTPL